MDAHVELAKALASLRTLGDAGAKISNESLRELKSLVEALGGQPDDLVIDLRKSVELGSETYARLQLREPTAAEWQLWDKLDGVEADVKAIATVSGMPEAAVRKIGTRDLIAASRFLAGFLS